MLDVKIQSSEPLRVAALRHVGPYAEVGPYFERIFAWAVAKGRVGPDTQCLGIYYDNPRETPESELRSAACLTVGPDFSGDPDAGVEAIDIEAGDYGVALFKGPYSELEAAYDSLLGEWLPNSGRTMADRPSFEVYLNSPQDTAPEELLTEIYLPLD